LPHNVTLNVNFIARCVLLYMLQTICDIVLHSKLMSAVLHNNRAHLHFLAMCVTYCTWTAVACAIAVAQAHDLDYPGPVLSGGSTGGERGDRPRRLGPKKNYSAT